MNVPFKRFLNMTTQPKIDEAIGIAESLLVYNSKMLVEISKKNDFKYESGSGLEVSLSLYASRPLVQVFTYKPKWIFSKAIGYSDGVAVYVNIRKLPSMSVGDVASNLLHEYAHHAGFGHGNNYKTKEKTLYSVPYFISENIQKWI